MKVTGSRALALALAVLSVGCSDPVSGGPVVPKISLSTSSITFTAAEAGSAAPAAKTVTISNSGGGTLLRPDVTVNFGGGATGWISVLLSGDAAPFTLTVTPSTAVADGAHTATISVASPGASNTPLTIPVAFTVTANAGQVIALSDSAPRFEGEKGAASPAAQVIHVTDGGGAPLSDLSVGTVTYGAGATGWLGAVASGFDVTLTATTGGLLRGRYTAEVTLLSTGAVNSPLVVPVTFDVTDPTLAVTPSPVNVTQYEWGDAVTVTLQVTNSADGHLAVPTVTTNQYWLDATVSGTSEPYTITLTVDGAGWGLGLGSHAATLTVYSANASNSPLAVPVTLVIAPEPTHYVNYTCNVPSLYECVEVTGQMTATDDANTRTFCQAYGGTIGTSCSTSNRIGTCTETADGLTTRERIYSGSIGTAADCTNGGGTWTPG